MIALLLACPAPVEPRQHPPEPAVILSLDPTTMTAPDGTLHGGEVIAHHRQTVAEVVLGSGGYTVAAKGSVTDVGGEPGLLEVHLGEQKIATLAIPTGPAQWVEADFMVSGHVADALTLSFINDHYAPDADRNITLEQVRLTRTSAPRPPQRADLLRDSLAGSSLVLISLDTLRADHLSAYGYPRNTSPRIDALAAAGVRFDHAISASHWTAPSHATLLTGLHPDEHDVVTDSSRMSAEIPTLAGTLSAAGYATGAFTGSHLVTALLGMDQGFETWRERPGPCAEGFADAVTWMQDQTGPFFLFAHTYQTHAPYAPPAPYDRMFTPDGPLPPRSVEGQFRSASDPPTPAELAALIGLYDGEIRAADACVGMLMEALGERKEHTLVVITSDHGEEFMERGGFGHSRLLPETLQVPLILSHPLLRTESEAVITQPAGAVDVVPTVLDLLGVPAPEGLSGESLVPAMTGQPREAPAAFSVSSVQGRHAAVRDEAGHFFAHPDAERLYVKTTHGEEDVLTDTAPEVLDGYRSTLRAWQDSLSPRAAATFTEHSDERLEALRAMGYVDWGRP